MTQAEKVGTLLRQWRARQGLSQLEFANQAGVSSRHVSFVETGRTAPSRRMVLHLAEHLGVPLRERNRLLVAAGYAPIYQERTIDSPDMSAARDALRLILDSHEPYPAVVVDRYWNLVESNSAVDVFLDGVDNALLASPINMMRLGLHPGGFAPRMTNLAEVRARLLARLARQVNQTRDRQLTALYEELLSYGPAGDYPTPGAHDIALPIRIRHRGQELAFISTIATFGTATDITLADIAIESYFPADTTTAEFLTARP